MFRFYFFIMVDYIVQADNRESVYRVGRLMGVLGCGKNEDTYVDARDTCNGNAEVFDVGFKFGVAVRRIKETLYCGKIVNKRDWGFVSALDGLKGLRKDNFWHIPRGGKVSLEGEIDKYERMLGKYFKECAIFEGSGLQ